MTMKIDSTAAKIGRSMKKRENMARLLYFEAAAGRAPALRRRAACGDLDRRTGADAHQPSTITLSPGFKPSRDDPARGSAVDPLAACTGRAGHHGALHRRLVAGRSHIDELALRPLQHGALGHQDRIGPRGADQAHAHELPGLDRAVSVGQLGLRSSHRAGGRIDQRLAELQLAALCQERAVGSRHFHCERRPAATRRRSALMSAWMRSCSASGMPNTALIGIGLRRSWSAARRGPTPGCLRICPLRRPSRKPAPRRAYSPG